MKKTTVASPADTPAGGLDVSVIAALAEIAALHDLSEVEVEHAGLKVRVARERTAPAAAQVVVAAAPAASAPQIVAAPAVAAEIRPGDLPGAVKSPMVGTAYLRPSPESKPFIEVGMVVKAGDKVMLVEAMKTFNEILAPRSGKVTHILVEDGTPVEYSQPLLVIE